MTEHQLPAVHREDRGLQILISKKQAMAQLAELQEFIKSYLVPGQDYGKMPGTDKDTLFKSGAEKLRELYGFYSTYTLIHSTENWDREVDGVNAPLFDYTVECTVRRRDDDSIVSTGLGSCNSYESKYKWRKGKRSCPNPTCGQPVRTSKAEYGAGYYCDRNSGGCGMSWQRNDTPKRAANPEDKAICEAIDAQFCGRVINDDMASQKNTVLKMAKKRADVDATISATRSSGIFTQDVEDFIDDHQPAPTTAARTSRDLWDDLKRKASERGFTLKAIQDFTRKLEAQGVEQADIYRQAKARFLEDNLDGDREIIDAEYSETSDRPIRTA